jgi:hypothetical protein
MVGLVLFIIVMMVAPRVIPAPVAVPAAID